jgi:3-phenylpropionate/trans-cinnamate dioxygenase ferredoxin reductase subunit
MTSSRTIVIVGASLAGVKAAETLRSQGFDGRIVLIGDEPHEPYQRPPLSKGYLSGQADLDDVYLHNSAWYGEQAVDVRTSTTVTAISPEDHQVVLADGERVDYHQLLLTTGASPRRLDLPGAELDGVHHLRTLDDTDRLKDAAGRASSVAVIGAGWIGCEVTAALRGLGLPVTLLDVAAVPLERVLGAQVGAIYHALHRDHGVSLLMESGVASLHGSAQVEEVRTTDGRSIPADLVVVGVGATPRSELAAAAGLSVGNGIVVDEHLRTSAPDVYAAGDVANAWHPLFGEHLRVEHWANALNQGIASAPNMLGNPTPYDRVPYFFSDQYDLGMEYSGHGEAGDQVVFRGDPAGREFIAFWLRDGVVVAGMNANVWDVTNPIQQLIRERAAIDPARLADPDISLDSLLRDPIGA